MAKQSINTFDGGMNKDLANRLLPSNKYRDAHNMRLVTTGGSTTGDFENIKGIKAIFDSVTDPEELFGVNHRLIGGVEIRDLIILFTTQNTTSTPETEFGDSRIWSMNVDMTTESGYNLKLLYSDYLNVSDSTLCLSTYYPIKAIARYETPNIQKIYWTDGHNPVRYANIAKPLTFDGTENTGYMSPDKFDFLPDFAAYKPSIDSLTSGKLNTGIVSYAYQLYKLNGAETSISPLSDPVHIVSSSDTMLNSLNYRGDSEPTNSGKGVKLSIPTSLNLGYNRLRLIRVYYNYLNAVPEISICNEIDIDPYGSANVYVTDIGDTVATLTLDEFNLMSTELFTCQDMAAKDNRLFLSNIEKKEFIVDDWDARAVRFNSSNVAIVNNSQGEVELYSDFTNWDLEYPIDHDGINNFNDPTFDFGAEPQYICKYKADGATLGAEGKNIEIDFVTHPLTIDVSNNPSTYYTNCETLGNGPFSGNDISYTSYASPFKLGYTSWQRDEVYRLFVVFGNLKGQTSDPKWICDLKMPGYFDSVTYNSSAEPVYSMTISERLEDNSVITYSLCPRISFKSFPANATWAQIYRVKREASDRSVVTQSLVVPSVMDTGYYRPNIASSSNISTGNLVKLVSPEILINKDITKKGSDYLEFITYYEDEGINWATSTSTLSNYYRRFFKLHTNRNVADDANNRANIMDAGSVIPLSSNESSQYTSLFGSKYLNYYNGASRNGKGCTGLLVNYINPSWNIEDKSFAVVNYKANVFNSQYGGNTYEDRQVNVSIPCSNIIPSTTVGQAAYYDIYYGDTFINFFDVSTMLYDLAQNASTSESVYVPLESSINGDLRHDTSCAHLTYNESAAALRQEYAGDHKLLDDANRSYNQKLNLYLYNTVYSQQIEVKKAIALPIDKIYETSFDTMIKSSNKKSNGEVSDSWTKFGVNEFIEVDAAYGPVNSIFNFNNKIFYFQDKAFGLLSINDRSVIQDTSAAKLVLGTGGVLDRFDYISILCGCKDKFSVVGGDTGMFWFDRINKYLIKYSDSIDKISISKGMQSFFNTASDELTKVIAVSDKNNNEILYTFYGDGEASPFTLAYSENIDSFISFYDAIPNLYIPFKNRYLSTTSSIYSYSQFDMNYLFIHDSDFVPRGYAYNVGEENQYYNNCSLQVLFNHDYELIKTWDNLFYTNSVLTDDGAEMYNRTFNEIKCDTAYQSTGYYSLVYGTNVMHRERVWTYAIPRNLVNVDITSNPNILYSISGGETRLNRERLRDKYMLADFRYRNDGTADKFVLTNIGIKYRISVR